MTIRNTVLFAVTGVTILFAGPATADIADDGPPPPCTLEARTSPGYDCTTCGGTAQNPEACRERLEKSPAAPDGYHVECRGPGRSAWTEIWCRKHVPVAPSVQTPPEIASRIESVTASSVLPKGPTREYLPSLTTDDDVSTSWQADKNPGEGKGEWILIKFKADMVIRGVAVANGFQLEDGTRDRFLINSRVESARLIFSDGSDEKIEFGPDQRGMVTFKFAARTTRWIKLIVEGVHPGTKTNDLAISEISLVGKVAER